MCKRFVEHDYDEVYYITDTSKLPMNLEWFEDYYKEDYPEDYEQVAKDEYYQYLYENSMSGDDVVNELNDLHEENQKFKSTIVSLMEAYQHFLDEQEGIVFGNAMQERIYALEDLCKNLDLSVNDLKKENGVDKK